MRPGGPLGRRAAGRLLRSGAWGGLVAAAFVLFAAAAAAPPLFGEAAANAALADALRTVPPSAPASAAPVVRVVGAAAALAALADGRRPGPPRAPPWPAPVVRVVGALGAGAAARPGLVGALEDMPGIEVTSVTAGSLGLELAGWDAVYTPYVAANGREARARLFGEDRPGAAIRPVPGTPGGGGGLWLPAPVAAELGVGAGDAVTVGVTTTRRRTRAPATVAGIYAVAADGRSPADPPTDRRWTERLPSLPVDSEFRTLPSYLAIGDLATVTALGSAIRDPLLFAAEGRLRPAVPTLAHARRTAGAVLEARGRARDPDVTGAQAGRAAAVREQVVSGLPEIVAAAATVSARTTAWAATVSAAGTGLGLLTVLAVALFTLQRRAVELRHAVGAGIRPAALGALAGLEVAAVAMLCAGLGLAVAWAAVAVAGPPGAVTAASVTQAAWRAGAAALAGVLAVALATVLVAARAARPAPDRTVRRQLPWELVLAAVAVTATLALRTRPDATGPPGPLDLLVPVLVPAALGAVAARPALQLAGLLLGRARRPVPVLAARRLAAGGSPAVLLVTVLATGLGVLAYSIAATASIRTLTDDRTATRAGARATAEIPASWQLDPGAGRVPPPEPGAEGLLRPEPVPGSRVPPLPAGFTTVWRARVTLPPEYANVDLLVVDPDRFGSVATWGTGAGLARGRKLLPELARQDAALQRELLAGVFSGQVPALAVGDLPQRAGDDATVSTLQGEVPVHVVGELPAFPGLRGSLPMVVVPAGSFLLHLGEADPRLAPATGRGSGRFDRPPSDLRPEVWTSQDAAAIAALLGPLDVRQGTTTTLAQVAQDPDLVAARRSLGFQVALGLCLAAIALVVLALFADRAALRSRPADLMLTRMGLRAGGPLRARALELAVLTALGLALAAAGVLAVTPLGPRLLDPGGGTAPPFVLRAGGLALPAAALAALAGLALAVLAARARGRAAHAGEVLRDAD